MPNIVTDLSVYKDWIARKGVQNNFTITVTQSSSAFDLTNYTFTLNIRKVGSSSNALQLTQGSGISNGGVSGILSISLTQAQTVALKQETYFYELTYVTSSLTYGFIHGKILLRTTNTISSTTSLDVNVSLAGTNLVAQITLSGGGGASSFEDLTGDPYANTDLAAALTSKADQTSLAAHTSNTSNPHSVTKAQVGLSNADNTSDVDKPVSTAQRRALVGSTLYMFNNFI